MHNRWFTSPSEFLSQLDTNVRSDLFNLGDHQYYKKNDLIFQAGSTGENIYILVEGRAKIYQLSPNGKEVILWFCFPGELFGIAEVCRLGRREVYARACSDLHALKINQQKFNQFLHANPDAAMLAIDTLSCRLRVLGDMLLNLTADDVMSRLVKLLTRLCAQYGKNKGDDVLLDIPLTHQEIADMIGASRQTVSSAISTLRKQGLIDIENHCIQIHDTDALIKLSAELGTLSDERLLATIS